MTLHIVQAADDTNFVWVVDNKISLPGDTTANIKSKIKYRNDLGIACGVWGDNLALDARDELFRRVESLREQETKIDDNTNLDALLEEVGKAVWKPSAADNLPDEQQRNRGLLVAFLKLDKPQIMTLHLYTKPKVHAVRGRIEVGDRHNFCNFFPEYYWGCSKKTIPELIAIGVHTVRMGHALNSRGIGDPDVWVFGGGKFSQLEPEQLSPFVELSKQLDASILQQFQQAPDVICNPGLHSGSNP